MKNRTKKLVSYLLCMAMLSGMMCFASTNAGAVPAEVQGNTFAEVIGMDPEVYMDWLYSHEDDNYYLGTPYKSGDHRNPNGDCEGANGSLDYYGVASMNCTGFVWHVLSTATDMSGGNSSMIPAMSGWVSFYNNNNISRKYFSTKEEMLSSGYLEKGDLIWMFEGSEYALSNYNHIGIYWGDGSSDVLWHSSSQGYVDGNRINSNVISTIIPAAPKAELYVVLKVGVPQEEKIDYDFNLDGVVSISDVTILQKYIANLISKDDSSYNLSVTDVNNDGVTDIADVTYVQHVIAGTTE
ncbi:MAG: dockerin type I repeat-containing protein [Acutalibacteraceae bacterium]|nr:dockerin type I repeat-containing protein [Acutalibacteraceae bacterium]